MRAFILLMLYRALSYVPVGAVVSVNVLLTAVAVCVTSWVPELLFVNVVVTLE